MGSAPNEERANLPADDESGSNGYWSGEREAEMAQAENEETIHERRDTQRHHNHHLIQPVDQLTMQDAPVQQKTINQSTANSQPKQRHHHHLHRKQSPNEQGHVKEFIKPDQTVRRAHPLGTSIVRIVRSPARPKSPSMPRSVATVVDEEQLRKRFVESVSERRQKQSQQPQQSLSAQHSPRDSRSHSSDDNSLSSSRISTSTLNSTDSELTRSPPQAAILIPANVVKSLSLRRNNASPARGLTSGAAHPNELSFSSTSSITREQLQYGPLLKSNEVQVLYRSPESVESFSSLDRNLKDEQAKHVAPNLKQSPIAFMSINPAYELQHKPLIIDYPATVENLRLNNTGFSWEVKIPYQISMITALHGAHLNQTHRYRLDQFHCHWGPADNQGSEHTVDNRYYAAELHFVHYNMEKYHTMSKAARQPDGLVVMAVFIDAQPNHHNHAELEKIVSNLKLINLKGEHAIIKQAVRIENLLPANRSYWSYHGSLTTPPYFESVTWFVLKHPIKCSTNQLERFRSLKSNLRPNDDNQVFIKSNFRRTQPMNGRTIVGYDEPIGFSSS